MAELVDALGSGSSWCKPVGVQVPFRVLKIIDFRTCLCKYASADRHGLTISDL